MRSPIKNGKTGFVRDVLTLSRGIFAAQVIAAGMSFVLTRLYTAEDFGEFALFAAALGMIGRISCLKYDMAIAIAHNRAQALELFCLCLLLTSLMSVLVMLALPLAARMLAMRGTRALCLLNFIPAGYF
jgi:O-antigen/teichoic acid export membrane protein